MTTIFKKIIEKEVSAEVVYENESLIVIKDIHPQAPIHLLIIPKKEIANLQAMEKKDLNILQEVALTAQKLAQKFQCEDGYRLLTNNGEKAGQTVFHLHFHFLAGRTLGDLA
jgi:histidine triad (HIT) family protein